jgi:hypothetical protein
LEGNAFQQNFEHAWNQFGVRGQVDIFLYSVKKILYNFYCSGFLASPSHKI